MNTMMLRDQKYMFLFIFIGISVICILYTVIVPIDPDNYYNSILVTTLTNETIFNPIKTILLWTSFFSSADWYIGNSTVGKDYFKLNSCPIQSCVVTTNRSYLKSTHLYDAVLFYIPSFNLNDDTSPLKRGSHQKYVFSILESPINTKNPVLRKKNFFNWTMTYRLDSDIPWPYKVIKDKEVKSVVAPAINPNWKKVNESFHNDELLKFVTQKKKLAAWFVSHCNTISGRDELAASLQKYMTVDIYGSCGPLKCSRNDNCDKMLNKDYKFYFAFENSLCEDYVTEKLFNNMKQYIVPVVYGGADYNRFAPPHSYINANDFASAKDLAEYLLHLDKNPSEYIKYFWWKDHYEISSVSSFCHLCMKLHEPSFATKTEVYGNIKEWWYGNQCNKIPFIQFR